MNKTKIKEMITIACPIPDGMIPISVRPVRDDLKGLLETLGFEFLIANKLEAIRTELDTEGKGTIHIDKLTEWISKQLDVYLDDKVLTEAFDLFDADHDGKINLEEFEFFMNGFAREMNVLRDNKLV